MSSGFNRLPIQPYSPIGIRFTASTRGQSFFALKGEEMPTEAIFTVEQPSESILVLGGEINLSNASRVKALLDEWLSQNLSSYTLDLRPLQLVDSSGLGLVVGAYRRAITQENPRATFAVRAGGSVLRVIQLIGLDRVLPVSTDDP